MVGNQKATKNIAWNCKNIRNKQNQCLIIIFFSIAVCKKINTTFWDRCFLLGVFVDFSCVNINLQITNVAPITSDSIQLGNICFSINSCAVLSTRDHSVGLFNDQLLSTNRIFFRVSKNLIHLPDTEPFL